MPLDELILMTCPCSPVLQVDFGWELEHRRVVPNIRDKFVSSLRPSLTALAHRQILRGHCEQEAGTQLRIWQMIASHVQTYSYISGCTLCQSLITLALNGTLERGLQNVQRLAAWLSYVSFSPSRITKILTTSPRIS